jgi:predicted nucleic acid-binding protein
VVLVDTTVWIDFLRGTGGSAVDALRRLLEDGDACLAPVVLQELLQGSASPQAGVALRRRFESLPMLEPRPAGATYAEAGLLYARCRWRGYTPRSPHDCLIAQHAIERDVPLLHDDRDFERITAVEPRLRTVRL